MGIPVIDLKSLDGDKSSKTMAQLHEACAKWGFFWVENHGIDVGLMEKVKDFVNSHYEKSLKKSFYESELAKRLSSSPRTDASNGDWETTFFIQHQPVSNIAEFADIGAQFGETMDKYATQLIEVAEKLAESLSLNLGLDKSYVKNAFSPPFVGTKVAKYPQCPDPDLVLGLRAHTDAGGIILLLQDDTVPGLEFYKDGEWVPVTLHRVAADKGGSRLSIATFYNPGGDAVISPEPKLLYPGGYRFQDYLDYYVTTKFSDKGARFQTIKEMYKP